MTQSHEDIKEQAQKFRNRLQKLQSTELKAIPDMPELPKDSNKKLSLEEVREQNKLLRLYCGNLYISIKNIYNLLDEIKWFLAAIDSFFAIYLTQQEEQEEEENGEQ